MGKGRRSEFDLWSPQSGSSHMSAPSQKLHIQKPTTPEKGRRGSFHWISTSSRSTLRSLFPEQDKRTNCSKPGRLVDIFSNTKCTSHFKESNWKKFGELGLHHLPCARYWNRIIIPKKPNKLCNAGDPASCLE